MDVPWTYRGRGPTVADAKTPKRCLPLPEAIRAEMERIDPGAYNAEAIARDVVGMCRKLFAEDSTQALGVVALLRDTAYGRPAQQIQQSGTIEVRFSDGTSRSGMGAASSVAADRLAIAEGVAQGEALANSKGPSDRRNGTSEAGGS